MKQPQALKPTDSVAMTAPAGRVKQEAFKEGEAWLARRYKVKGAVECLHGSGYLAGSDEHRRSVFQSFLDQSDVKAILSARGGFGTTRILDDLNLDGFKESPKWIVGSSDLTALLMKLWEHGIKSIHGPMVAGLGKARGGDLKILIDLLEGRSWTPPDNLESIVPGKANGPFIGGNLTMLAHMAGTIEPSLTDGAVLLLEDVGELPYRLDRCLVQLSRAGFLDNLGALILGDFTGCNPGPDKVNAQQVLEKNLKPLAIPVAAGYPAAHGGRNHPFIHGASVTIEVTETSAKIS